MFFANDKDRVASIASHSWATVNASSRWYFKGKGS
jgi:hypothetical protein